MFLEHYDKILGCIPPVVLGRFFFLPLFHHLSLYYRLAGGSQ
jgi:hypothetical protein